MTQSKIAASLCQILHQVSHKTRCWPNSFSFLYISGMHKASNKMHFAHSGDDTTAFASDGDINNVHDTVDEELMGVYNWLKASRLSLNISKSSYMKISNRKNSFDNITI